MRTANPATNVVDHLHSTSETKPRTLVYRYLETGDVDGASRTLTYAELDRTARAIAARLIASRGTGERALMLYPPGLDFMTGFFGCLYAGTVAVPAYPPDPARLERTLRRLQAIVADCNARFVVTTSAIKRLAATLLDHAPALRALEWIATDEVDLAAAAEWVRPAIDPVTVAFLQYTSGSTGDPKGVVVTHANLLANEHMMTRAFGEGAARDHVAWLPLYHDMGLIGKVVHAPVAGVTCTFMAPLDFLTKPSRWLRALSTFKAGFSAAPNFAYDLCVRRIPERELEGIDLSNWTSAVNAAEPVRADTLARFSERFARYGFRSTAFAPAYGLAEATLLVTTGDASKAPPVMRASVTAMESRRVEAPANERDARAYVGCGRAWDDHDVRIVDPETRRACPPNEVGEIWVRGASVGDGYWNRAEASEATFRARLESGEGPYLRTGDLGFLREGELFVSGRWKDLVILRGRNHLPNDIEHTVEKAHASVRGGCTAAFPIDVNGEEALAVVAEIDANAADPAAIAEAMRRAVGEGHDVAVHTIVLIEARTIAKTTSGKIQRRATKAAWQAGKLRVIASFVEAAEEAAPAIKAIGEALTEAGPRDRRSVMETFVRAEVARAVKQPARSIDPAITLVRLGLDSLAAVELRDRLEEALGVAMPASVEAESPTVHALADALLGAWLHARVAASADAMAQHDDEEMRF